MRISDLIRVLDNIQVEKGDLPVATMMTRTDVLGDSETAYEMTKAEYLEIRHIEFSDSEFNPKAEGPNKWVKIDRSGVFLVIDAT